MKEKLSKTVQLLFAYGIGILMIAAILVAVAYLIAFIVGCPHSEMICGFLDTYILPCMYIAVVGICILGVINMYLCKEHTFVFDHSIRKKKD